jgi:CRP-like cAMP-binding protein
MMLHSSSNEDGFDYNDFVAKHSGATISKYRSSEVVYSQGDPAEALFYLIDGNVKISVISEQGREGIVAMLQAGDFFGEGCLSYRVKRASTVVATGDCEIVRLDKTVARRAIDEDPAFSRLFVAFLLKRNAILKDTLLDQLFNPSEKRLARILLTLSNAAVDSQSRLISIPVTQETLAKLAGTTRSRISQFMTKFRKLGYIEYDGADSRP